jgi:gas vesicle protein
MKKLLIVLAAGVAVGLLLAPDKGSETRKKLMDSLDDIKDKAVDEINGLIGKSKTIIAKGQEKAQAVSQDW